jgi:hypothetical protein
MCVCLHILASSRIPQYDLGRQIPHFGGGSVTTIVWLCLIIKDDGRSRVARTTCDRAPSHDGGSMWCDVPPLSKDGQSQQGLLWGIITEVMTHNTSRTRIKHMKCSES